jgi:putative transcriptional regulator
MASHIERCPACRETLSWLEHVGGALLESLSPAPVSGPAPVVAMRAGEAGDEHSTVGFAQPVGDVPGPLVQAVGGDLDAISWTEVGAGVWEHQIALKSHDHGHLRLTKVAPGQKFPEYNPRNSIIALVLKGSCRDSSNHYSAGDVAEVGDENYQSPIADPDHGCICLIATDQRL